MVLIFYMTDSAARKMFSFLLIQALVRTFFEKLSQYKFSFFFFLSLLRTAR